MSVNTKLLEGSSFFVLDVALVCYGSNEMLTLGRWSGKEEKEIGICKKTGKTRVRIDERYYRPAEVDLLHGNPTKAKTQLGWTRTVDFPSLVEEMVKADLHMVKNPEASED